MRVSTQNIVEVLQRIWDSMLGLGLEQVEAAPQLSTGEPCIAASILLYGPAELMVVLCGPIALARRATAAMLQVSPHEPENGEIRDGWAELVNMIAGGLERFFSEPCRVSMPFVAEGRELAHRIPDARPIHRINFNCQGLPLCVTLAERQS